MTFPFNSRTSLAALAQHVGVKRAGAGHSLRAVLLAVLASGKHHKIFKSIIVFDSVDVVDVFVRLKNSAVRLFPDVAMLTHVALLVGVRVSGHVQNDVSVHSARTSAIPAMIIWPKLFGAMAGKIRNVMVKKPSLALFRARRNSGWPISTPTLADTTRNTLWWRNVTRPAFSCRFSRFRHVAQEKLRGLIFMSRLRHNRAAAAAFTEFHEKHFTTVTRMAQAVTVT